MNEQIQQIADATQTILRDQPDQEHESEWDSSAWAALESAGLTTIAIPESLGGGGGSLAEAAEVLRTVGTHATRVPIAEVAVTAPWLLIRAGLPLPTGVLGAVSTYGEVTARKNDAGGWELSGIAHRVGYARIVDSLALLAESADGPLIVLVDRVDASITPGQSLAGDPSDDVDFSGVTVDPARAFLTTPDAVEALALHSTLARLLLMSGAAQQVLALTLRYVSEREQFGRAIGRLQVVQHLVAELAGEATALQIGADAALLALQSGATTAWLAVASAKIDADRSATRVTAISHQLHGAIGATHEHALRRFTLRLWSWREEGGTSTEWSDALATRLTADRSPSLWEQIVGC